MSSSVFQHEHAG